MKAAYKWKIQNGIYGYITDEENYGPFIYEDESGKRCVVGDGGIATATTTTTKGYRVMKRLDDTHIKIIVTSF